MRQLIGITGYKGSGKSTVAFILQKKGWMRRSFASPIRCMLITMGINERYLRDDKDEIIPGFGCSGRHLLQTLGTEWGRNMIHKDIWVMASMDEMCPDEWRVFDDVRFPNEVKAIVDAGGMIVKIDRDSCESDGHESESYVKSMDAHVTIANNRDVNSLEEEVGLMEKYYEIFQSKTEMKKV